MRFAAILVVLSVTSLGCFGSMRAGTAKRTARAEFMSAKSCEKNDVKTQVVEVLDPPSGVTYLARVRAEGCLSEQTYLCANIGDDWACKRE